MPCEFIKYYFQVFALNHKFSYSDMSSEAKHLGLGAMGRRKMGSGKHSQRPTWETDKQE